MKRVFVVLLAVLFMASATSIIYAASCKNGKCTINQKKTGSTKADPNSE